MSVEKINIVIIGAGKVARHLGKAFLGNGHQVVQVYNRTLNKAKKLAGVLNSAYTDQLGDIDLGAKLYLLCVADNAIASLSAQLTFLNQTGKLIAHTSGATPSSVFQDHFQHFGVFYPLQSLSPDQEVDFRNIPICLYASRREDLNLLQRLAQSISHQVYEIDDYQRSLLHVAAVFVNNFSNHIYHLMDQFLQQEKIPFELLHPLIQATGQKLTKLSPGQAQTGPATRGDLATIERHLALLAQKSPELIPLYEFMTASIKPGLLPGKKE